MSSCLMIDQKYVAHIFIWNINYISGLVLIFGIQRTRVLWDIVIRNKGSRAGLLRAGWVSCPPIRSQCWARSDQWEACIRVTWLGLTNQRPVFRSHVLVWPIRSLWLHKPDQSEVGIHQRPSDWLILPTLTCDWSRWSSSWSWGNCLTISQLSGGCTPTSLSSGQCYNYITRRTIEKLWLHDLDGMGMLINELSLQRALKYSLMCFKMLS